MTQRIEKIKSEITKSRKKIEELQRRIAELEEQQTDLENTEIIQLCRSAEIPLTQLQAVLRSCKATGDPPPRLPAPAAAAFAPSAAEQEAESD